MQLKTYPTSTTTPWNTTVNDLLSPSAYQYKVMLTLWQGQQILFLKGQEVNVLLQVVSIASA
jgi:hypothetical protein